LSGISTHVLDTSLGQPAAGIQVTLELRSGDVWKKVGGSSTGENGRAGDLVPPAEPLARGTYRLRFDVAGYFRSRNVETFFPEVSVTFEVRNPAERYHVPLLLSPWGYSTYRGS
jgi:5-hydroxyisourate hydrolase